MAAQRERARDISAGGEMNDTASSHRALIDRPLKNRRIIGVAVADRTHLRRVASRQFRPRTGG